MKTIKYIKLFEYLRDVEELEGIQIFRTIIRIRKLPKSFLIAVNDIIEKGNCNLEVEGVSYEDLVEKDGMKPIRAILFLDWLRTEPESALAYMEEKAYMRAPIQPLTEEEQEELNESIKKLKELVDVMPETEPEVDKSKDDIIIEDVESTTINHNDFASSLKAEKLEQGIDVEDLEQQRAEE